MSAAIKSTLISVEWNYSIIPLYRSSGDHEEYFNISEFRYNRSSFVLTLCPAGLQIELRYKRNFDISEFDISRIMLYKTNILQSKQKNYQPEPYQHRLQCQLELQPCTAALVAGAASRQQASQRTPCWVTLPWLHSAFMYSYESQQQECRYSHRDATLPVSRVELDNFSASRLLSLCASVVEHVRILSRLITVSLSGRCMQWQLKYILSVLMINP